MKQFFLNVLSTIVGIFAAGILSSCFFLLGLVVIASAASPTTTISNNSVLAINLSGSMSERANNGGLMGLFIGNKVQLTGLDEFRQGVQNAKKDDKIKGIYLEAGGFNADSYATLQEARRILEDFKKSGKWIIAYADTYTQGSYYLASVANKVYLNPQGIIDWHGLVAQPTFYKDAMAKLGIKMQVVKVGKYKSATEPYTENKMSEANREQTAAYLNAIWSNITKEVSQSRGISVAQLNALADSGITFADPKDYLKQRLVDGLLYTDEIKNIVKKQLRLQPDDDLNQATLADVLPAEDAPITPAGTQVAVYYATGDIVDGVVSNPLSQMAVIDAQRVCKDLEELSNNDDVKAVVLRINSGGGSAYASEQIWHQIMQLKKKKPVVVSMGGMAASGAYYMSAPANWIVAEPTTLTGSIGIFGTFSDFSELFTDKLGLKFDQVQTNKYSDFGNMARPFNANELHLLEQYINRGYALFRSRVAEGRHMTVAQVENVAQGHVFAGQDAAKIGLVDELGSLQTAIGKAAKLAKITDYEVADYPAPADWFEELMAQETMDNYLNSKLKAELGSFYQPYIFLKTIGKQNPIQARIPYEPNIH